MSIAKIYQLPTPIPATVGILPAQKSMICGNTLNEVTAAGFLSRGNLEGAPVSSGDILQVFYNYNLQTQVGDYASFSVDVTNGVITLTQVGAGGGGVVLPVVGGHFANFIGTDGTIGDVGFSPTNASFNKIPMFKAGAPTVVRSIPTFVDSSGSIHQGNVLATFDGSIQATSGGLVSGSADGGYMGSLKLLPSTPNRGSINITAYNDGDNFDMNIAKNGSFNQTTTFYFDDPSTPFAHLTTMTGAPPPTSGNVLKAGAQFTVIEDAGYSADNVQLKSQVIANIASTIGSGAGPYTVPAVGCAPDSVLCATINDCANLTTIQRVIPLVDEFAVILSNDPGSVCEISYIIYIKPQ